MKRSWDLRKNPILLFCWTDMVLNWLLMIYHYIHRLVHRSTLLKEASVWSRWWLKQRQLVKEQGIKDCRILTPKWSIYITSPPFKGSGTTLEAGSERLQEPEVVDDHKESVLSRHSRAGAHMSSLSCDGTCKNSASSNQIKARHGEWRQVCSLTRNGGAAGNLECLGEKESAFSKSVAGSSQSLFSGRPHTQEYMGSAS